MPSLLSIRKPSRRSTTPATGAPRGKLAVTDKATLAQIRFIGVTEDDLSHVARWRKIMEASLDPLMDSFHEKVLANPETAGILNHHSSVERQRPRLSTFVRSLMSGVVDDEYVAYRARVGEVHDRIELGMAWYIAMYESIRDFLEERVEEAGATPQELSDFRISLARIIQLDIPLTVEALAKSRQRRIEGALADRDLTQQWVGDVPEAYRELQEDLNRSVGNLRGAVSAFGGANSTMQGGVTTLCDAVRTVTTPAAVTYSEAEVVLRASDASRANVEAVAASTEEMSAAAHET